MNRIHDAGFTHQELLFVMDGYHFCYGHSDQRGKQTRVALLQLMHAVRYFISIVALLKLKQILYGPY
jgi:hypothetical protein